ncbi:MAG: PDZ domain-containing protein [Thermoanaerobaculia bacterium]
MKKTIALMIPVLALGTAATVSAADKEHKQKCGAEATFCIREMATQLRKRGWIGIEWNETDGRPEISHVVQGSPAAAAGVEVGDIVMSFEGVSTDEEDEVVWAAMKRSLVPGKVITLAVVRDGTARELQVELVAVPDHVVAQWVGKHMIEHAQVTEAEE